MQVAKDIVKKVFPASSHPSHIWPLSLNDLVMPPVNIRWITFYENPGGVADFMDPAHLETSLSKVLDLYPLVAGRLVDLPQGNLQIEYNPENLQGCSLILATANFTLESLRKSNFAQNEIPDELKPETVFTSSSAPLFTVQRTQLACGSVAMGYSMGHKIGDGYSVHNFIDKWAKISRGLVVEPPLLDRSVLAPNKEALVDSHPEYKVVEHTPPPSSSSSPSSTSAPQRPPASVRFMFTFSPEKVTLLKSIANSGLEPGRWVSTNDSIVTLVWRVLTRARGLGSGATTACGIAVDGRKKWNTPKGNMDQYFGNFVTFPVATCDAGKLTEVSLGEAALLLRAQVEKMDHNRIQSSLNWIDRVPDKSTIQGNFKFFGGTDIFISSWLTFPMYDCDFKWGKPVKALLHAPGNDGISLILPRGPAAEADKYGLDVVFGCLASHADEVKQDQELAQFATVVIE